MKKAAVVLAVSLTAAFFTGCATAPGPRVYTMNATGYAAVVDGNTTAAKTEAEAKARQNLVKSIARFMEYRFTINNELEQKILFGSKPGKQGVQNSTYFAEIEYELNLNSFLAKNGDFRNIYAWEMLGLAPYYSEYINAAKPIGVWIRDQLAEGKRRDPAGMGALSVVPFFSGNFMIGKQAMGGFFTVSKMLCLGGALLKAEQSDDVRNVSWVGLAVLTALDVLSVFTETSDMNERLKDLQDALYAGKSNAAAVYASVKF